MDAPWHLAGRRFCDCDHFIIPDVHCSLHYRVYGVAGCAGGPLVTPGCAGAVLERAGALSDVCASHVGVELMVGSSMEVGHAAL
jgi:hypothetical protein